MHQALKLLRTSFSELQKTHQTDSASPDGLDCSDDEKPHKNPAGHASSKKINNCLRSRPVRIRPLTAKESISHDRVLSIVDIGTRCCRDGQAVSIECPMPNTILALGFIHKTRNCAHVLLQLIAVGKQSQSPICHRQGSHELD